MHTVGNNILAELHEMVCDDNATCCRQLISSFVFFFSFSYFASIDQKSKATSNFCNSYCNLSSDPLRWILDLGRGTLCCAV